MKALKKELEQSHGRAVAIIDSALNATEKEQATNQLIASDGSHGGNREARAIANENGAVQATKRGRGRPTKKAERLELAPAKVAKTRGSGIKAPPPIRNNRVSPHWPHLVHRTIRTSSPFLVSGHFPLQRERAAAGRRES
jgi:hypothetical protein